MPFLQLVDPPSKVYQDDFSPAKGNALQACVAAMFGESLSDVPNFVALDIGYEQGIRKYVQDKAPQQYTVVKQKNNLCDVIIVKDNNNNQGFLVEGQLCILRGKSPRGDFGHVVVARILLMEEKKDMEESSGGRILKFEMVHDPHPDGTFLDESEAYGWYMIFLPKTQEERSKLQC